MKTKCIPIILSGGAGTRLWPLSRRQYPKQFIPLFDNKNLFTMTLERIIPLQPEHIVVVCSEAHRFIVIEHLSAMNIKNCTIIAEPVSRNTAPAITLASLWVKENYKNTPMLVLPSDHYMDGDGFGKYINDKIIHAAGDYFVTFGIKPTQAEIGYGYIQVANTESSINESHARLVDVDKFIEKPDYINAEEYVKSKRHYWNSGIFLFKAEHYISALRLYRSDVHDACIASSSEGEIDQLGDYHILKPAATHFKRSPDISIDYAIMEHVENIRLCPLDIHWSDLGSWQALSEEQNKDSNGNTLSGAGDIVTEDSKNNIVHADNKLVVCLGIDNHLIAETKDAVLVADRSRGQEIKQLVDKLREVGYTESDLHTIVHRPWGSYESVDKGENFQVKRIIVKSGQRLSLQSHQHRAEHWVIVKGKAKVTLDEQVLYLEANQSVYIPIGAKHRLENEEAEALHLIEVQCGDYLEEDDIRRYEDNYGRINE